MPPARRLHGFHTAAGFLLAREMQVPYTGLFAAGHVGLPTVISCQSSHTPSLTDEIFNFGNIKLIIVILSNLYFPLFPQKAALSYRLFH